MKVIRAKHQLQDSTISQLIELKLADLTDYIDELYADPQHNELDFIAKMEIIIGRLYQERINNLIASLRKRAGLREPKAEMAGIRYDSERLLSHEMMASLGSCDFMHNQTNIIIEGPTGSGKTYIACALANAAIRKCYKVKYIRLPDLQQEMEECRNYNRSTKNLLKKYASPALLVIDEWLLRKAPDSLCSFLLDIMEKRYTETSTIFCTQSKQADWHEMLGGNTQAEAIIDRIIQNSITVTLGNLNMRSLTSPSLLYKK